ncbi:MAG TPA: hypothetical protein VL240_02000 [Candidatus Binatia bacterium]|nr:hypothetical protein [Candidatus Binatia bacterium]
MKHLLWLTAAFLNLSMAAAAAVHVTVTTPTNNSQVGSPFNEAAHASSSYPIVGWAVYLDSRAVYTAGRTQSINTNLNAPQGHHQLVTRAWDSTGAYGDAWEQITVTSGGGGGGGGGGNGLPTPPPGAIVFNHIEDRGNWHSCHDPACSGGSGSGTDWMAQYQGSPSRDGSSTEFYNSGSWGNTLWVQKLGANNGVRNFLWDFYFYLDGNAQNYAQALEFDAFQFIGGYNYMIGTECDYGSGKWDTWDEASGHWIHSSISCPRFSTNTWHHIQWYMTTNPSAHQYTYVTLVVDGHSTPVHITRNARNLHWGDNLGVQWQLDDNARGGGYHEWIDSAKLTIW